MSSTEVVKKASMSAEERFQLLVSGIRDYAIYLLNPQGIVTSWNAGAERFKGYSADEIIGQHFSRFYTAEDQATDLPRRALEIALKEGKFEAEGWRVRKDGTRFWASVVIDSIRNPEGELVGFAKVTRDITERKLAQEALRESEERFRLLVQGVTDYAICMLTPTGEVANWNSGAQRIKGYSSEEIVGQHFSRFYTEEDRANGLPALALATAEKEGRYEKEGWRVRKDGSKFLAHVIIDAIRGDDGKLIGFAKITRDITEKQQAAEALQRANAALFQSQKMEAIGQLTGGVAHDFNNLLSVISNTLDLLAMKPRDPKENSLLETMRRAVDRGALLTQQLLSFARQQPLQPEKHNLNKVIEGFEAVLRRAGNSSIIFDFRLALKLKCVLIDAALFETSLLNLIVNARDAMPKGGKLAIATANVALRDKEIDGLPAGDYVKVSVADSGTGMPPEVMARVFEPFFTTKEIGKGTGLGLSQVYGFIAQSGGDVKISSEVGKGTEVSLYLPVVDADDEEEGLEGRREKVLIVEDEIDLLDVAAEIFSSLGYEVLKATSGTDALDILKRVPDVNMVFSDVMMPHGMSGIDLAKQVQEQYPSIRIVLASGYPKAALKSEQGALEKFTFVSKPYRLGDLVKKIRSPA